MSNETIVAVATPPGQGGIGIIRLSGVSALSIAQSITGLSSLKPRYAHHASFYNHDNEIIDMGLVLYFKGPKSFTGEDIVEFQGHGSPVALERLLARCIECGARMAHPGEFCQRAFLNDKIDLTQAEAIADLIAAQSASAARMAVHSLKGRFSDQVNAVLEQLIALRCYVEAAIDFPDEEIDFLSDGKVASDLTSIIQLVSQLVRSANQGVILRDGINIVLAGKPNAGKSTLLNQLAGQELAIVTDIPGTTRDVMRQHLLIDDIPVHMIDTAGLRDSDDVVEREGIKRAWSEINKADCVLLLIDVNQLDERQAMEQQIKQSLPSDITLIEVINKVDLVPDCELYPSDIAISAKLGQGLTQLKQRLKQVVGFQESEGQFLARSRHVDALKHTQIALKQGQVQLLEYKAGELLAEELKLAQKHLSEITGEFSADDLLGKIFSSFCIGK